MHEADEENQQVSDEPVESGDNEDDDEFDSDDDDGVAAPKGDGRKRTAPRKRGTDHKAKFQKLAAKFKWVDSTKEQRYIDTQQVWCLEHSAFLKGGSRAANIGKHDLQHQAPKLAKVSITAMLGCAGARPKPAAPVNSAKEVMEARAAFLSTAIGTTSVSKHGVGLLFGGPLMEVGIKLYALSKSRLGSTPVGVEDEGAPVGAEVARTKTPSACAPGGTTDRAMDLAEELHYGMLKDMFKGKYVWLGTDEATWKLGNRGRYMIIMIGNAQVAEHPVMIGLVRDRADQPIDDGDAADASGITGDSSGESDTDVAAPVVRQKPYQRAARHVRHSLDLCGIDIPTQVTAGVGDLAPFERALYRELGISVLICIPHALALVFKALTEPFKRFETCTVGFSALISAGGGIHRADAIAAAGMDARRFRCINTRWGQLHDAAQHLLMDAPAPPTAVAAQTKSCFDVLREIMATDGAFKVHKRGAPAGAGAADVDADEGGPTVRTGRGRTPVKSLLKRVLSEFEVGVADAMRTHVAEFELRLVLVMAERLPALLTMGGADAGSLNPDLGDKLVAWREQIATHGMPGMQGMLIDEVLKTMSFKFAKEPEAALRKTYIPLIREASKAAVTKYDEYIPGALDALAHTLRFHPGRKPQSIVIPEDDDDFQIDSAFVEQHFGVVDGRATLVKAWNLYCDGYDKLPAAVKALSAGKFWVHPSMQKLVRDEQLCKLGVWHGNKPTSNVACERGFGVMRTMEGPTRGALKDKSIRQELQMAKVNYNETLWWQAALQH